MPSLSAAVAIALAVALAYRIGRDAPRPRDFRRDEELMRVRGEREGLERKLETLERRYAELESMKRGDDLAHKMELRSMLSDAKLDLERADARIRYQSQWAPPPRPAFTGETCVTQFPPAPLAPYAHVAGTDSGFNPE